MIDTATPIEMTRASIACIGAAAALIVALFTIKDYRLLRRDGVNGPTGVVYAERGVLNAIFLFGQVAYVVVGVSAMLAPPPIPPNVAAMVSDSSANATMSVATYLDIAVKVSIYVTSAMLAGSLWQLVSRSRLSSSLREKSSHARSVQAAAQAQTDRMEATGAENLTLSQDTNARIRAGDIGRDQRAIVNRGQADAIQETGEDSNRILRDAQEDREQS